MAILITGAAGFIGENVVKKLLLEKQELKLFVRDRGKINLSANNNVKICKGDLTDKESVYKAVEGCETVIHLGAVATKWERNPEIYFNVNYIGTKNILEACLENKIRKIVYTSTPLSPVLKKQPANEISRLPEYVKSKLYSEQLTDSYIDKGLDVSVVYPTRVFGPGKLNDANSATQVIDKYLRNKFPFILNGGKNKANWVYIEDVAEGIILAAQKGKQGKRYVLGGENVDDDYLFNLLDEISGKKHLRISLPFPAALGIAYVFDFTSKIFSHKPLITSDWLKALCENNNACFEETINDLGYSVTPIKESLKYTVNWLNNKYHNN
jgi:farnesol dehydrogenase